MFYWQTGKSSNLLKKFCSQKLLLSRTVFLPGIFKEKQNFSRINIPRKDIADFQYQHYHCIYCHYNSRKKLENFGRILKNFYFIKLKKRNTKFCSIQFFYQEFQFDFLTKIEIKSMLFCYISKENIGNTYINFYLLYRTPDWKMCEILLSKQRYIRRVTTFTRPAKCHHNGNAND